MLEQQFRCWRSLFALSTVANLHNNTDDVWQHFQLPSLAWWRRGSLPYAHCLRPSLKIVIKLNCTMSHRKIRKDLSKLLSTWRHAYSVAEHYVYIRQHNSSWGRFNRAFHNSKKNIIFEDMKTGFLWDWFSAQIR